MAQQCSHLLVYSAWSGTSLGGQHQLHRISIYMTVYLFIILFIPLHTHACSCAQQNTKAHYKTVFPTHGTAMTVSKTYSLRSRFWQWIHFSSSILTKMPFTKKTNQHQNDSWEFTKLLVKHIPFLLSSVQTQYEK